MSLLHRRTVLGKNGKQFVQYKITTMRPCAEEEFVSLVSERGLDGMGKPKEDPRITPKGKRLRRVGLDEVPQVYNILRGEMALIGIRPRTDKEWEDFPQDRKSVV